MQHSAAIAALQFYVDHGVDSALGDEGPKPFCTGKTGADRIAENASNTASPDRKTTTPLPMGKNQARAEAIKLAKAASTRDELRKAIAAFDEIGIKKTATNLVFCDGNPDAPIMLVGEAPGADEDRQGKPFVGVSGQLLDRILACIDLDRTQEDAARAIYISNILNWRPPGNRTPAPAEVEVSLPFIERHIQLVRPKLLILCGGVSAKALLGRDESVSRLRKTWHDYLPVTPNCAKVLTPIPAIATYHPAYLLRTPAQKKAVWADMLSLQEKRRKCGLL